MANTVAAVALLNELVEAIPYKISVVLTGAVVSEVARRHSLQPQQLFAWRREARKRAAVKNAAASGSAFSSLW